MNLLKLKVDIKELYTLTEFVNNLIGKTDFQIDLILEEIFVNIVDYSNSDYIYVDVSFENQYLTIEFIDNGIPFNTLLKENPKPVNNIDEAEIGGLGIYLTKQMADEISYQYINDENHLKITKKVK